MKKFLLFLFFISFSFANELTPITIQLKSKHQFKFAGFYIAKELGFYKKYGLDVNFKEFDEKTDPLNNVLSNKNYFGIDNSSLIYHKLNGKDIVLLFSIFKSSPIALFTQEELFTLTSLNDKKIEFEKNEISNISIHAILKSQDIYINTKENNSSFIEDFINKKTDAIIGYLSEQQHILEKKDIKYNIFLPKDYGFDFYGDMIYTSSEFAKQNPILINNFIEATKEGWKYAFKNIPYTVEIISKKYNSQNKTKDSLLYEATILKEFSDYSNNSFGEITKFKIREIENTIKLLFPQKFKKIDLDDFIWNTKDSLINYYKKNYLLNNKEFTVCIQDNLFPIDGIDNNKIIGISGEILNDIAKKFEFSIKPLKAENYEQNIKNVFENKCDIVTVVAEDAYKQYKVMNRSNFYLESNLAIITKIDKPFIENSYYLNNNNFVVRYEVIKKYLLSYYPNINIKVEKDLEKISSMIRDNKIDGFITDNITVDRTVQKLGYNEFKISGFIDEKPMQAAFAINKNKPELLEIINLGLSYFSKDDIKDIEEKYKVTRYTTNLDKNTIVKVGILITFVFLIVSFFIYFLKRKNNELNEWLNSTIEGVGLFENERIIKANKQLLKILGYEHFKEIQNMSYFDFVSPTEHYILEEKLRKNQEPYEIKFIKKDGTLIDGLAKGHYIKNSKKRISVIIDISELKKTQRQLKELNQNLNLKIEEGLKKNHEQRAIIFQQAKLAEMGSMMNMIAHQWRQPLNNISLLVSTIIIKHKKDNLSDETLNILKKNFQEQLNYLSNTIDDFQNFFNPQKNKELFSINEVVLSALNLINPKFEKNQIQCIFNTDNYITYFGYKNELAQVLLTILNNSLDAFEERKDIFNKFINISIEKDEKNIIINIEDNAGGTKEDNLEKIFDLYFSTKTNKNGTGLGLYISKTIINRHFKGEIKARNHQSGLKITIFLPTK